MQAVCRQPPCYVPVITVVLAGLTGMHFQLQAVCSQTPYCVLVTIVVLAGLTGMHKTGCSGETRLVLHTPSAS